jgi:hypothetical protein
MPTKETVTMTRREMYDLVWSKPMRELAGELGFSDVALGKWCRSHDMPTPGVGYWQKVAAGKRVLKPKLRDPDRDETFQVTFTRYAPGEVREDPPPAPPREVPEFEVFEGLPENRIVVADTLTRPHPLVAHTKAAFAPNRGERAYSRERPALNVRVSPGLLPRALLIMDTLIKALEARGMRVTVETVFHKTYTFAYLGGVRVPFDLIEGQCKGEVYDDWSKKMKTSFVLSGQLVLRVCSEQWGWKKEWRDKEGRRRIEDCLNKFMIGLHEEAENVKAWDHRQEQQRIEREDARCREEELRRRKEAEAAKVRELEAFVQNWKMAADIRGFLDAVEQKHAENGGIEKDSDLGRWIQWGRSHAEHLDPLVHTPNE